jgi:hypothetical protein
MLCKAETQDARSVLAEAAGMIAREKCQAFAFRGAGGPRTTAYKNKGRGKTVTSTLLARSAGTMLRRGRHPSCCHVLHGISVMRDGG